MIEITQEEAVEKVNTEECLGILWSDEGCPNCELFEPRLDSVQKELPHWKFYKINISNITDNLYFEPHMYPTTFIFYKGERKLIASGIATEEDITSSLNDIFVGSWKTDKELEQEQLDALDE